MNTPLTTDVLNARSIHFVGIKGVAMAALAVWAKEKGLQVTGSDVEEIFPTDVVLKNAKITVFAGFRAEHISDIAKPDLVVFTGAHGGRDNAEVLAAQKIGIPVLPHGKALGMAMAEKRQISVAGSHGKTTTTAMIATILLHAKLDPSYAIGCGEVGGLGLPGHFGKGEYFIAEADEYVTDPTHDKTPRFLWQKPEIMVVTNIDYDHPDVYESVSAVQKAFISLKNQQTGNKRTIVNADDPLSEPLLQLNDKNRVITYGISIQSAYHITNSKFLTEAVQFEMVYEGKSLGNFILKVPGSHNILNAAAAAIACHEVGVSWDKIQSGLQLFTGAKRRFEKIADKNDISYYDDYAHHPKEIQATLKAARAWHPDRRILAVFQPHTYSRTQKLLKDFGKSFIDADVVVCTDIYASAREHDTLGITGETLVNEINKHHTHVVYAPNQKHVKDFLISTSKKGDVVVFMGAGDIYTWEKNILLL